MNHIRSFILIFTLMFASFGSTACKSDSPLAPKVNGDSLKRVNAKYIAVFTIGSNMNTMPIAGKVSDLKFGRGNPSSLITGYSDQALIVTNLSYGEEFVVGIGYNNLALFAKSFTLGGGFTSDRSMGGLNFKSSISFYNESFVEIYDRGWGAYADTVHMSTAPLGKFADKSMLNAPIYSASKGMTSDLASMLSFGVGVVGSCTDSGSGYLNKVSDTYATIDYTLGSSSTFQFATPTISKVECYRLDDTAMPSSIRSAVLSGKSSIKIRG